MIRVAAEQDAARLAELEAACFGADAWSARLLSAELIAPGRTVLVDEADDGLLAYGSITVLGDVADLTRIAVDPGHRRRGVAARMLDELLVRASRSAATRMLLEVAETNATARALYARAGFAELARRRAYYADGGDALVLQKELLERRLAPEGARD